MCSERPSTSRARRSRLPASNGRWTEIAGGEGFGEYKLNETRNSEALLLGRVTYEGFAAAWPSVEGEFGDRFDALPKYAVSSTLVNPSWNNSTVLGGDELRVMVFPVVLGTGKRLFGATSDKKRVHLTDTKVVGDGIVVLTYSAR